MKSTRSLTMVFGGIAALMGCNATTTTPPVSPQKPASTPTAAPAPVAPAAQAAASIASALPNANYVIDATSSGKAPLKDGLHEEAIADSSSRNIVRLGPEAAYGDLDGDHADDAAVTLLASSGGSGSFTYVAAVLNRDNVATPVASVFIGDRITMKSIRIVDGMIRVTWLDRTTGAPMSTPPDTELTQTFILQDGKLLASGGSGVAQLRGHYTWGHEVETFQPCGSRQSFWVVGDRALLQPLRDKATAVSRVQGRPYRPIYVEASGRSEGKARDGFAADYNGVYRFTAVHAVNNVGPAGCTPLADPSFAPKPLCDSA